MRRACVLRQLGRCAEFTPFVSTSWSCPVAGYSRPVHHQELRGRVRNGGAFDAHSRPFTTGPTLKASWKVASPLPPSVHPHPHPHSTTTTFDALAAPEQFRSVMRLLPNSVVVCTSAGADSVPRGMTMSSFTSLSLQPTPLITFNMATPSRTLDAVSQSREFNIHVLSGDVDGARVADWFRRGNAADLGVFEQGKLRDGCGCEAVHGGGQGDGRKEMAPLLRGRGILYGMKCKLLDDGPSRGLVRVRDHVVVLAEVVDILEGRGEQHGQEVFGLAYADRQYRQLAGTIVPDED